MPRLFSSTPRSSPASRPRFFRSMANATKRARERIEQHLTRLQRPRPRPTDVGICRRRTCRSWTHADFRRCASATSKKRPSGARALGSRPGADPGHAAGPENAGIVCGRCSFGAPSIDGVSHWSYADDRPHVLISSDKRTAVRSRFDAAHELGHLVLHRRRSARAWQHRDEFKGAGEPGVSLRWCSLPDARRRFAGELPEVSLEAFASSSRAGRPPSAP